MKLLILCLAMVSCFSALAKDYSFGEKNPRELNDLLRSLPELQNLLVREGLVYGAITKLTKIDVKTTPGDRVIDGCLIRADVYGGRVDLGYGKLTTLELQVKGTSGACDYTLSQVGKLP